MSYRSFPTPRCAGFARLAACMSLLMLGGCYVAGEMQGAADAGDDVHNKRLAIKTYGTREYLGTPDAYDEVLERYGVALVPIAGCCVTDEVMGYVAGYNKRMSRELDKRFGKDFMQRAYDEAVALHEARESPK